MNRSASTAPALLLPLLLLAACADPPPETPPPPAATDVLLRLDGLEITFGEVEPWVKWLDEAMPEGGHRTKVQKVLQDYLVPLKLAQRSFAEQRRPLREQAHQLRSVATNVAELEQQGAQATIRRQNLARSQIDLPVAAFLFDPLTTRGTSEPIEVPRGFLVAAAHDLRVAGSTVHDLVDAVMVGFMTHTAADFETWKTAEQERVADRATYIHPGYREAMPTWLKLP